MNEERILKIVCVSAKGATFLGKNGSCLPGHSAVTLPSSDPPLYQLRHFMLNTVREKY